ncbi:hypothetical protein PROFUN_08849 [Planoprotostelium fungivorum]|uniref:Uncharacterized protein n=1 Tax=Planoprotostelium fungivorum TaxID=1890364 RepID=A0A2P6NIZ5_9EUKA|nr:hypothetical protein PROFUN_08849 [Planoprotostelium fungivorum]
MEHELIVCLRHSSLPSFLNLDFDRTIWRVLCLARGWDFWPKLMDTPLLHRSDWGGIPQEEEMQRLVIVSRDMAQPPLFERRPSTQNAVGYSSHKPYKQGVYLPLFPIIGDRHHVMADAPPLKYDRLLPISSLSRNVHEEFSSPVTWRNLYRLRLRPLSVRCLRGALDLFGILTDAPSSSARPSPSVHPSKVISNLPRGVLYWRENREDPIHPQVRAFAQHKNFGLFRRCRKGTAGEVFRGFVRYRNSCDEGYPVLLSDMIDCYSDDGQNHWLTIDRQGGVWLRKDFKFVATSLDTLLRMFHEYRDEKRRRNANVNQRKTWLQVLTDNNVVDVSRAESKMGSSVYEDGSWYDGSFDSGECHDQGEHVWANGDVYEGNFLRGKKNGQGTVTHADGEGRGKWRYNNGDSYEGSFHLDEKHGQGKYVWEDGDTYVGEFKDDMLNGKGVCTEANGDRYEGGQGSLFYANGNIYRGEFENGHPHGKGVYTFKMTRGTEKDAVQTKGKTIEGRFVDDELVEEEKSKKEIPAEQPEEENRRLRQAIETRDLLQAMEQRVERESRMVKEEMERLREEGREMKRKLDEEYRGKLAKVQRRMEESRRQDEEKLKEAQRRVQVVTGGLNWDTYCQVNQKKAEERQREEEEECIVCFDAPQVTLPCRHKNMCEMCYVQIKSGGMLSVAPSFFTLLRRQSALLPASAFPPLFLCLFLSF